MKKTEFKGAMELQLPAGYMYDIVDADNILGDMAEKVIKTYRATLHFQTPSDLPYNFADFFNDAHLESATFKNRHGKIIELRKTTPTDEKS